MGQFFYRLFYRERPLLVLFALAVITVTIQESNRPFWQKRSSHRHQKHFVSKPAIKVPTYFKEWRENFIEANSPYDQYGLVRGIFLGADSSLTPEVREAFRNAGLSHLLAASGYNCWIVAFFIAILFRLAAITIFGISPSRVALLTRKYCTPIARLLGAWLFWLWTDQSPPITRSVIMISALFAFELYEISSSFGRLLLVQYLLSLVVLPRLWHSVSFQLTFGCLFGILVFPNLVKRFEPHSKIRASLWKYFVTGLGACLGTFPTTIFAFGQANFSSLATNWFAVPPVSFILMPLGLFQMLLLAPRAPWQAKTLIQLLAQTNAFVAQGLYEAIKIWGEYFPSLCFWI